MGKQINSNFCCFAHSPRIGPDRREFFQGRGKRERREERRPRRKRSRLVAGMNGNMATEKEKEPNMKQRTAEIQAAKGHEEGG